MTNEEKAFLVECLVDAGDIDSDGDVEAQFMKWYRVREEPVSGEIHYKAVLEAVKVRKRSYQRCYRLAGTVRWCEDDSQRVVSHSSCDHDDPCGCYAEGHAAGAVQGREERRAGTLELIARLREILDDFEEAWK
jgi:hypothetical protein